MFFPGFTNYFIKIIQKKAAARTKDRGGEQAASMGKPRHFMTRNLPDQVV
jgi:hypothetical protein